MNGEGGIRTHGGLTPTPVFETGALIHYATSPQKKAKGRSKKAKVRIKAFQSICKKWFAASLLLFTFLLLPYLVPARAKELLHDGATFRFEHAGRDFYLMIQRARLADMKV